MYFNVDLDAACTFARKIRFSGSLGYNLTKGKQEDIRSGKG